MHYVWEAHPLNPRLSSTRACTYEFITFFLNSALNAYSTNMTKTQILFKLNN